VHIDEICFIIYQYSPTRFGHFCDYRQGSSQEYWYSQACYITCQFLNAENVISL